MRILPVQSLRGIASLMIILLHFKNDSFWHQNVLVLKSAVFVDFFFVLSGFVIALNYSETIKNSRDLLFFQKKRFFRLYPVHLVTLLFFTLYNILKIYFIKKYNITPNVEVYGIADFLQNIFLIQGINGASYNLPSWSISVEFYTYLIFAFFVLKKNLFKSTIPMILIFGLFVFLQESKFLIYDYMNLTRCIYCFFLGILLFYTSQKFQKINQIYFFIFLFLCIAFITKTSSYLYFLSPILFFAIILCVIKLDKDSLVYKFLSLKPLVYLGTISYSLYMIHFCITIPLRNVLILFFKFKIDENGFLILGNYLGTVMTFGVLLVCILLSSISYKFIEDRFRITLKSNVK